MKSLKKILGNTVAAVYFVFPMSLVLLLLIFMPIAFLMDISAVRGSGFAGPNSSAAFIGFGGLFIGLSLLIPPLRKMYRVFPWLYSFTKIFYVNLIILCIGESILNFGYEVQSNARHITFFILMIVQLFICRIGMCIYFKLKPVKHIEER
ncbi:hypothetical protein [Clostridium weizhouense]|uniref:Uncharacterized protein n=1 Tax=Clostridium weizhouense TaxID=2859781 RepID=A0ABS7ANA1_9CLOT|nr:hypothetical protein [Clostridium weizhouense]MBW6410137.1 hypothetical protein [Clostridium weizhouense]